MEIVVDSPSVKYTEDYIETNYDYHYTHAEKNGNKIKVCINYFINYINF